MKLNNNGNDMRVRLTDSEKEFFVSEFKKGNKTQTEFARERGLSPQTFSRWVREDASTSKGREVLDLQHKGSKSLFMPVLIQNNEQAETKGSCFSSDDCEDGVRLCLTLKSKGFTLDIPTSVDASSPVLSKMIQLLHKL